MLRSLPSAVASVRVPLRGGKVCFVRSRVRVVARVPGLPK